MNATKHPNLDWTISQADQPGALDGPRPVRDQEGNEYTSARDIISGYFPPVDGTLTSAQEATRDNRLEMDVSTERARQERSRREATQHWIDQLAAKLPPKGYRVWATHKVLFDPMYWIHATVPVVAYRTSSKVIHLIDVELSGQPSAPSSASGLFPLSHMSDTPRNRQVLRLSMAAHILQRAEYLLQGPKDVACVVVCGSADVDDGSSPEWRQVPYLCREVAAVFHDRWAKRDEWGGGTLMQFPLPETEKE